ncbi:MAG: ribonuclease HII [Balneolaceae bacterium]
MISDGDDSSRLAIEKSLWSEKYKRVMGLDEVGRGCLSGPVVAAGVILSPDADNRLYRDSKELSKKEREKLAGRIRREALYSVVCQCEPAEIDRINILQASLSAMRKCVESGGDPDFLLVDGNRFLPSLISHRCIVKGDQLSASIAAASILAKVHRDRLMKTLHKEYPFYGWNTNVGYPTKQHYEALQRYGYTPYHRLSFRLRTSWSIRSKE